MWEFLNNIVNASLLVGILAYVGKQAFEHSLNEELQKSEQKHTQRLTEQQIEARELEQKREHNFNKKLAKDKYEFETQQKIDAYVKTELLPEISSLAIDAEGFIDNDIMGEEDEETFRQKKVQKHYEFHNKLVYSRVYLEHEKYERVLNLAFKLAFMLSKYIRNRNRMLFLSPNELKNITEEQLSNDIEKSKNENFKKLDELIQEITSAMYYNDDEENESEEEKGETNENTKFEQEELKYKNDEIVAPTVKILRKRRENQ
ncbi:hypothetical protein [Marinococcus sp. PL1-022]|uniref:hypothetical protein n=1 Tax=Marinococcus sp. PL1-022 TaxID=3095363 RepID=UPI0029C36741|nr:hypothetical protein [Marinococcus sp. PL1-022]MDX6151997.1 hypothetical protein [Marinococcus sp. PL1-022]